MVGLDTSKSGIKNSVEHNDHNINLTDFRVP